MSVFLMNIKVYVLTHKEIEENYDCPPYVPLLNGSALLKEDFGYLRDDTGENISKLNINYAELTGQYWAWKNSDADIIGFCQYRRWFVRNFKYDKLTEEDIQKDLENFDIILPQMGRSNHTPEVGDVAVNRIQEKQLPHMRGKVFNFVVNGGKIH